MKVIIYSIKDFERPYLFQANKMIQELTCVEVALCEGTAALAQTHKTAVVFTGE